jgi:aspartate/methionine/tyrosine aminotransferase
MVSTLRCSNWKHISQTVSRLLLGHPNPTGAVLSRTEIMDISGWQKHDLWIVCGEVYADLTLTVNSPRH